MIDRDLANLIHDEDARGEGMEIDPAMVPSINEADDPFSDVPAHLRGMA